MVFAGSRDHYQVALALQETGRLHRLINELYLPAMPVWMQRLAALIAGRERSSSRVHAELPAYRVQISWLALMASLLNRALPSTRFVRWKDAALGRACGRMATGHHLPVVAYSYYASYVFEQMPANLQKIIFQVHPHPAAVRRILLEELQHCPASEGSLSLENELNFPAVTLERLSREALCANHVITPSSFAKQTLVEAGVNSDRIVVVPYGIDSGSFYPKSFDNQNTSYSLRLIFVGSIVQRKGLSYLLEAVRQLRGKQVELVLVGRGARDDVLLDTFSDVPFRLVWNASREELVQELQEADVFIFPSLVESFAHVILEAMSVGLPVITTTNTAGPDLLEEGRTGFVGPIRDVDFLVRKIRWFLANPSEVSAMGRACQKEAAKRTWSRFRSEIREALDNFRLK